MVLKFSAVVFESLLVSLNSVFATGGRKSVSINESIEV